jgi:hypothetical protein
VTVAFRLVAAGRWDSFQVANEPLAIRKRYGVAEEISLSFLRHDKVSILLE